MEQDHSVRGSLVANARFVIVQAHLSLAGTNLRIARRRLEGDLDLLLGLLDV
jgi:hypothetical protein